MKDIDIFPTYSHVEKHFKKIKELLNRVLAHPEKYRHQTSDLMELPTGENEYFNYIPEPIRNYILQKGDWIIKKYILQANINIPEVTLYWVYDPTDEEEDMNDEAVREMCLDLLKSWFYFLSEIGFKTNRKLEYYMYFTPFKKVLPVNGGPLTELNINTGYTFVGQNCIYIYRREDWFKVLLHETMHKFESDSEEVREGVVEKVAVCVYVLYEVLCEGGVVSVRDKLKSECDWVRRLIVRGRGDERLEGYVKEREKFYSRWGVCVKEIELEREEKSLRGTGTEWRAKSYLKKVNSIFRKKNSKINSKSKF